MVYATPLSGASISITPPSGLVTTAAGGTATFDVVLTSQPTADVTFNLYSSDLTEGTASPSVLTFTNGNWNVPQTVTITGVNDNMDDDDIAYSIITTATISADLAFDDLNPTDVAVTNTDNDTPGIGIIPTSGLVTTEARGTPTFAGVLRTQPTADVMLDLAKSETKDEAI